jgi:hypothetical protein
MRCLLDAFPAAARRPNADAALPIHVAVTEKMPMPVIKMLYQAYPVWLSLLHHVILQSVQSKHIQFTTATEGDKRQEGIHPLDHFS